MNTFKRYGAPLAFAGFVATVWLANLVVTRYGIVNVGFGFYGPAAVYVVGVAFTLRDILHRLAGPYVVIAAIIVGAGLSLLISPTFAVASGVAFLVSELADLLVYTPLHKKTWVGSVALSNTVGLVLDSVIFLTLAFGSLEFFWGQVIGKGWMTLLAVLVITSVRAVRHRAVFA